MEARINASGTAAEKAQLWEATGLLLGLKYEKDFVEQLLEGVMFELKDSSIVQAALQDGERNVILRQGSKRFGEPNLQVRSKLEEVKSLERLEELSLRLLEVESWDKLLS